MAPRTPQTWPVGLAFLVGLACIAISARLPRLNPKWARTGLAFALALTAGLLTYRIAHAFNVLNEEAKLTASDGAAGDQFGVSVAVDGETVLVGARFDDAAGPRSGSAYVFVRGTTGVWTEQAKLTASDAAALDDFGFSVSVGGETVVVGAHGNDDAGSRSGSAYVFVKGTTGVWTEAKLNVSDGAAGHQFGYSASVDGDTVVVGARFDDDAATGPDDSGSAYAFVRETTGVWTEQAKLTATDRAAGDRFGSSVSVDGETALVGAVLDDDAGSLSGSAYVFNVTPPTPQELIEALVATIVSLNLPQGLENSLVKKLDSALAKLEDGNPNNDVAAINKLGAFINESRRSEAITSPKPTPICSSRRCRRSSTCLVSRETHHPGCQGEDPYAHLRAAIWVIETS